MSFTYLASPYSHADQSVVEDRFRAVCRVSAMLMSVGVQLFSPIAHTHPIALYHELPAAWEFWSHQDFGMLRYAEKLLVLKLDGWEQSKGIAAEIGFAEALGIPVRYAAADRMRYQ